MLAFACSVEVYVISDSRPKKSATPDPKRLHSPEEPDPENSARLLQTIHHASKPDPINNTTVTDSGPPPPPQQQQQTNNNMLKVRQATIGVACDLTTWKAVYLIEEATDVPTFSVSVSVQ